MTSQINSSSAQLAWVNILIQWTPIFFTSRNVRHWWCKWTISITLDRPRRAFSWICNPCWLWIFNISFFSNHRLLHFYVPWRRHIAFAVPLPHVSVCWLKTTDIVFSITDGGLRHTVSESRPQIWEGCNVRGQLQCQLDIFVFIFGNKMSQTYKASARSPP